MVTVNKIQNYNVNFTSYRHLIKNKSGDVINRGDTCFFRHDLDFLGLIDLMDKKYSNVSHVNIINHACSDAEEVYSFLAVLNEKFSPEKIKKFLPITACDINKHHIELAKQGVYNIESFERGAIDFYLGNNFDKYFDFVSRDISSYKVKVNSILQNQVNFKNSNIVNDAKITDFENTVLFARNFWPYIKLQDMKCLAMYLSHNMDDTSLLVIGDYDKTNNIDVLLKSHGFRETSVENVYENVIPKSKKIQSWYLNTIKNALKK